MDLGEISANIDYDGEEFEVEVDGTKLKGQKWVPKGDIKFKYVFVHGVSVFITFYRDVFSVMNSIGAAVYACDHYGHGKSSGIRGSGSIDTNVNGVEQVVLYAAQDGKSAPIIIHGHSMGGLITIKFALTKREIIEAHVCGIIAEAPWLSSCPQRNPGCCELALFKALRFIAPDFTIPDGVDHFAPDQHKEWIDNVAKSPLYYPKISPKLFLSAKESQEYVRSQSDNWNNTIPYLFLQGGKDTLVSPSENSYLIRNLSKNNRITFQYYEDCSHVMLKTPMRKQILDVIIGFIEESLPK